MKISWWNLRLVSWSLFFVFGILAGGIVAACGGKEGEKSPDGFAHILMTDNTFAPPVLRVPIGGTIEFVNAGGNPHNAIAVDKSWSTEKEFGQLAMARGTKVKVTYPKEGIFPYYCSFHASPDGKSGMVGDIIVGDVAYNSAARFGKTWKSVEKYSGTTRRVPGQYPTIQNAVDASQPGDMVLVEPGVYYEEVVVTTPSITIRGTDRNKVIIDGQFQRGNGVMVVGADGVAVENMTARNATLNGFFWTGVTGYRASYLTAYNNGDYGIYAFDSHNGVFEHSYASGSPDSGIYVGQCYPCHAILYDVVSENNALGYSGTNSGGELYIIGSVWKNNIVGIAPNTLDRELLPPERETTVIGNLVYSNNNPKAPISALEYPSFGNGILLAGGLRNIVKNNVVVDHVNNGIVILPNLDENIWLSHENKIENNVVYNSGKADILLAGPISIGNCFQGNKYQTILPALLEQLNGCNSALRIPLGGDLSFMIGAFSMMVDAADGTYPSGNYKEQPIPGPMENMPGGAGAPVKVAVHPFQDFKLDLENIKLPAETDKVLASVRRTSSASTGPIGLIKPLTFIGLVFHIVAYLLPFMMYVCWTSISLFDLLGRKDLVSQKYFGWIAGIAFVPYIGAGAYLLAGKSQLPKWFRLTLVWSGIGAIFLLGIYSGISLMNGVGPKTIG
ncbi:plastocyanin [Leptospira perolatii]|uniref:Plastocyanin n=1 Tax=Leptospira perolatii TaxID=2023191 RepID=A0A2M9ZLF0_9LEPT|nr:right-handed parallel beta-helix repeat-containing protein [Leptospira perolatii]PJZ70315.1 plastocyanin [Leptospira perolatii]PJZ72801.1 plastocyanin [Leptospira perolatii]